MDEAARSYKIVLGVIGADCHAVGGCVQLMACAKAKPPGSLALPDLPGRSHAE